MLLLCRACAVGDKSGGDDGEDGSGNGAAVAFGVIFLIGAVGLCGFLGYKNRDLLRRTVASVRGERRAPHALLSPLPTLRLPDGTIVQHLGCCFRIWRKQPSGH